MATKSPISDDRWRVVERVADSPQFQKAVQLRDLLLYICDHSIQARHEELREQRIGEAVFRRGEDFRPNDDTIVRVEARKLRKRLEDYFATEGKDEPIVISIPKGAYIASFEAREPNAVLAEPEANRRIAQVEVSALTPPRVEKQPSAPFNWAIAFGITAFLFAGLALRYWIQDTQNLRTLNAAQQASPPRNPLWSALFNKDQQTYIVCADSGLVLYQEMTGAPITLAEYVNRNYPKRAQSESSGVESMLKILPQRQYTNISDVRLVQGILQSNLEYVGHSSVRHARDIETSDFKTGNFILIGSRRANPWVELFEKSLNFRFAYDSKTQRPGFRNMNPLPNEKSTYWLETNSGQAVETYSVISFVSNLAHNGSVLMIGGASGEGTEAAGEFTTHLDLLQQMLDTIHARDRGRIRYFEVLLKSGTLGGTSGRAEIVAYRVSADAK